jgi:subtilisin
VRASQFLEVLPVQRERACRQQRDHRGAALAVGQDQGELTEGVARAEHGVGDDVAELGGAPDRDQSRFDQMDGVAEVTLVEDHFTRLETRTACAPHDLAAVLLGQLIEDRLGHGPKYCPIMADRADPTGPDWDREATATSLARLRADTRAKSVSFAVLRDDVIEYVAGDGPGADAIIGTRMPVTNGFAGYCASSGQSIEVVDPQRDARFGRDVAERSGIMPARLLVVPVQRGGHTIGVVTVIDRDFSVARAIDRAAVTATEIAEQLDATADDEADLDGELADVWSRLGPRQRARALDFLERLDVEPPEDEERPAWSEAFEPDRLPSVAIPRLLAPISRAAAFGRSTGAGVRVAVLDSGIDATHPDVGAIQGSVAFEPVPDRPGEVVMHETAAEDVNGHGTACASVIRSIAPDCELFSVRVLSARGTTRGYVFSAGIEWAIDNGMHVVNLSLSSSSDDYFGPLHELADRAAFANVMLVGAMANTRKPTYPSEFASVFSVASHDRDDPLAFDYNPHGPAEWGARGIDVPVAWLDHATLEVTGNSFAASHLAGILALLLGEHPGLTPFQAKAILSSVAGNAVAARNGGPVSDR